jgi:hypothetical protein
MGLTEPDARRGLRPRRASSRRHSLEVHSEAPTEWWGPRAVHTAGFFDCRTSSDLQGALTLGLTRKYPSGWGPNQGLCPACPGAFGVGGFSRDEQALPSAPGDRAGGARPSMNACSGLLTISTTRRPSRRPRGSSRDGLTSTSRPLTASTRPDRDFVLSGDDSVRTPRKASPRSDGASLRALFSPEWSQRPAVTPCISGRCHVPAALAGTHRPLGGRAAHACRVLPSAAGVVTARGHLDRNRFAQAG